MISKSIDIDFYSRQIGTFGLDTTNNLMKMKILIYGMRGLGMEIAKNIILMGPNCVSLYDKNVITHYDLGSGFYFSEDQINKEKRDEGCVKKLAKLNPYVDVNVLNKDLISSIEFYDIIIITELININLLNKINIICREKHKGLIYGAVLGLITFIFVDFGEKFTIKNLNGEEPKKFYIKNITKSNKCLISIDLSSIQKKSFKNGDFVKITEIEGMTELNDTIKKINAKSLTEFYIEDDSTNYNEYIKGGILEEHKIEIEKNFLKFIDCINEPKHEEKLIDDEKDQIRHSIIYGIMEYYNKYNDLPELNDVEKSKIIVEYSKEYFKNQKKSSEWFQETNEIFDEEMALNIAKWSRAEISPICNFIGGIMAQEIVKYTGKYTPIDQWLWFDFYNSVKNMNVKECILNNSRYDEQISIFGNDIQNKLSNANIYLIGAGALGCEYLKLFSMMGI
jgi:ubiquitin-activating enzyme E1